MAPDHDALLNDLIDLDGDLDALRARRPLTPSQLRAFANDPAVLAELERWHTFCRLTRALHADTLQAAAAKTLLQSLSDLPNPNDRRRAATTLARLTTSILSSPSSPAPSGGGGRGSARPEGEVGTSPKPPDHSPPNDHSPPDDTVEENPSLSPSPLPLARHLADLIPRAHKKPHLLVDLHPHLSPSATILGHPTPHAEEFPTSPLARSLLNYSQVPWLQRLGQPDDPDLSARFLIRLGNRHATSAHTLRLTRATPTSPWQISALTPDPL